MAKKKLRFLFQGDSVTDAGRDRSGEDLGTGYPYFFREAYETLRSEFSQFPELEWMNRGVSGDRSTELLARTEADILALEPDVLFLQIGVNDAWRLLAPEIGATPDQVYEANLRGILNKVRTRLPDTFIVLMEPFLLAVQAELIGVRRNLYRKINVLRNLRKEYADIYWPLDGLMHQWSLDYDDPAALATDGIHPTEQGHRRIAEELLRTFVESGFFDDIL